MPNQESNKLRYLRAGLSDNSGPPLSAHDRDDVATDRRPGNNDTEFISVPEWCRRVGCAPDSGYRAARRNEIPGLFRIGRLMRINWPVFVEAIVRKSGASGTASREGPVA
jgi:predicted DNA-binding transcriptional regulator AlpA